MDQSWFSKASASASGHGFLSSSQHELPRWRSPDSMVASMIPPPIVQSTYSARSPPASSTGYKPDQPQQSIIFHQPARPTPIQDRQSELEADLQFLLDAQAAALLNGIEGAGVVPDESSSTGSTTPTAQSVRRSSFKKNSRPARRPLGVRSARKGIYNSIVALSAVKEDELHSLEATVQEKDHKITQIAEWEQKRIGLQQATRDTNEDEENVRAQRLRREADSMQQDINQLELQLMEMKAKQRKLLRQAAAAENSVQATMASYTSALSMLETDVQRFLSLQPVDDVQPATQDGRTSMWELPPKRRTLEMARDQFNEERETVMVQRQNVEREKSALKDGAEMWKTVTIRVTEFEKRLRSEMAMLGPHAGSAWEDQEDGPSQHEASTRLKEVLDLLRVVLSELEAHSKTAEEKEWRLLIAAIGAEIDALTKGKTILESVVGAEEKTDPESEKLVDSEEHHEVQSNGEEIHELDDGFAEREPVNGKESEEDDEDPDPELLFSTREEH